MQRHRRQAHRVGRLDGDHAMAHRREPRRIAPGSGTDVENAAGGRRDQMEHRPVRVDDRDAFVALEEILGLVGIAFGAAYLYRRHAISPKRHPIALSNTTYHCGEKSDEAMLSFVIPGWSEGPDLRCAIAHRGISRFRVRVFDAPRNDGSTATAARWRRRATLWWPRRRAGGPRGAPLHHSR